MVILTKWPFAGNGKKKDPDIYSLLWWHVLSQNHIVLSPFLTRRDRWVCRLGRTMVPLLRSYWSPRLLLFSFCSRGRPSAHHLAINTISVLWLYQPNFYIFSACCALFQWKMSKGRCPAARLKMESQLALCSRRRATVTDAFFKKSVAYVLGPVWFEGLL